MWLLVAALSALVMAAVAQTRPGSDGTRAIIINVTPITEFDVRDPAKKQFGALEFIGGLELRSPDKDFGGLSGLQVSADGRFLAVSDKARWFRGRIVYRDGLPSALADVETAPVLGADGQPITARGWYDTESIARNGGTLYVGIERVHEVLRFDYGKDGLMARGQAVAMPQAVKELPRNRGLEAMAVIPAGHPMAGTLLALSEEALDKDGNIVGFLVSGPNSAPIAVTHSKEFAITDAAFLPGGDLLLLERHYSPARGVAMRIRQVSSTSIKPGAVLDGKILIEADLGFQIDNMEGIAVHQSGGRTILTLVSDDNFSSIQRTILLQFALTE